MKSYLIIFCSICLVCSASIQAAPRDVGVDYDIIYVRYPANNNGDHPEALEERIPVSELRLDIPSGEFPYVIEAGADLMLLKPDGTEITLVDCTACSVMDPFVSYDASTVYYSLIEDGTARSASWIYKINLLSGPPYTPIRLTFDDGFESLQYAGNTTAKHAQSDYMGIKDMAPVPLADGRILITTNRAGLTAFDPHTNAPNASVQQLYVFDDHDGGANTAALSNLHRLETGSLHLVQHPIQLKDGRILFSTWQDVAHKYQYATTPLFTVHPDGSNLRQFTEPHDHSKLVEHFVTQLPTEHVVAGQYYPLENNFGFGRLMRYPISDPSGVDFLRFSITTESPFEPHYPQSYREFDRKGTVVLTAHTHGGDSPAPNRSGKYAMPAVTVNGDMLVSYSPGYVNLFDARCNRTEYQCEALKSGIYIIRDAGNKLVTDPSQLALIKNDPLYNEIWPRPVVTYKSIFGQSTPDILPSLADRTDDERLPQAEATAIIGTSSMYNRDPSDVDDVFNQDYSYRERHNGNWTIQGAEAGLFTNSDIHAVRIVTTPPKPYTKPLSKWGRGDEPARWEEIKRYLNDPRLDDVVARYGALHNERWEILGEFPLVHKGTEDGQGNPDTSWMAKIPADTPFLIQALDQNGMTVISELTWRALKSGENRTDCGGCHAHSIPALDFSTTQSGKSAPIRSVSGIADDDPRIAGGMWDLTTGSIPILNEGGTGFVSKRSLDVEFNRDVLPILNQRCVSCHTSEGQNGGLILDGEAPNDAWGVLTNSTMENGNKYNKPQRSKYIRVPQARQSMLTWIVYGQRLDGRQNDTRDNDVDFPSSHPNLNLTDTEKRTIARWIDLGSPIDFPNTEGFGYTDDNQLPVINVFSPKRGLNQQTDQWKIGFADAKSGVDYSTLTITYSLIEEGSVAAPVSLEFDLSLIDKDGVLTLPNPVGKVEYILEVRVNDFAGNLSINRQYVHFGASSILSLNRPTPPENVKFIVK